MVNQKDERNSKISFELEKSQVVLFSTFASFEHSTFMQCLCDSGDFFGFPLKFRAGNCAHDWPELTPARMPNAAFNPRLAS